VRRSSLACALFVVCACSKNAEENRAPPRAQGVLAPALRRLSVAELELSAAAVLGTPIALAQALPPDALQTDFSRNIAQSVDSLTLRQLYDATRTASEDVALTRAPLPSCAAQAQPNDAPCARDVVVTLADLAFRRAATEEELNRLLALFTAGREGGTFRDGVALVSRALLASPQLLYESSLGDGAAQSGVQRLSQAEIASALSFLITGAPPDSELTAAAVAGQLHDGSERQAQAVRLLSRAETLLLFQRFVEEWLGLVQLPALAKSSSTTADFGALSRAMRSETRAFVADVFRAQGGSLQTLFAGGYSLVPDELAPLYGIRPVGPSTRVSLRSLSRVGLLQQGSFLSVFAHEAESAPVLRGKAVLVRLLCRAIPQPQELGIDVVPPAPDPHATTRQRFERHVSDPLCATCHSQLDPVGFTFEGFDAIGRPRDTEQGQPVDTHGSLSLDGAELALTDSVALSDAIAQSQELRTCAARQVVRFAGGRQDPEAEAAFVAEVATLPPSWNGSLLGLFLSYVKSERFAWRKAP
jgi:hypothetical protein